MRDFRPCVTTNDVAALYDTVSGTIFYLQGGLLATGGVERTIAVTARWKGGAVTEEADLSIAGNWDCYDADGNVMVGATPTAVTTVLVEQGSPLLSLPAGTAFQDWAGVTLTNSVTLSTAADWSPLGLMTLADGVTVDLNGHDLVSGGFVVAEGTSATNANTGTTATLTLDVADGATASMAGITFANNITFVKTGNGTLASNGYAVGDHATGTFTLFNGTFRVKSPSFIIGNNTGGVGTLNQTGGTLDIDSYLTMGYLNGAYGTYNMTGGNLIVRTQPMNLGQTSTAPQPSTFDLSGTGVATFMRGVAMSVHNSGGRSELNVHDGGRIRTSSITKGTSANASPTLTFDGGILEPLGNVEGLLDGMPLTIGSKGFIVDTAGHNVTLGNFTLTSTGGELVKFGTGTLTITNAPALGTLTVSNGTLKVTTAMNALSVVHVAEGAVLDLDGNTLTCGTFSGSGTVTNGSLTVTVELRVDLDNPPTFTDVLLNVDGAQIDVAGAESITGHDPIVVLTSNRPITGRPQRTNVPRKRWQIAHEGDVYRLELVLQGGLKLFLR